MAANPTKLTFPDDIESHEQFMHFRISEKYKFKREKIDTTDLYATVTLPLPVGLSTSYAATYSSEGLGLIGNMAAEAAPAVAKAAEGAFDKAASGNFSGAIDQLQNVMGEVMGSNNLKDVAGKLLKYYGPELAKQSGTGVGAFLGDTIGGGVGTALGAAIGAGVGEAVKGAQVGLGKARNPYLAAAFEGVGFKTHSFAFQLNPRNAGESNTLALIISAFRNAMLPTGKAVSQFYDYPQQFDIIFGDATYLFDIKTSVCTQFDVNYHGKGAYYHDVNGKKAPVEVTLNMSFLESTVRLSGDETGRSSQFKVESPSSKRFNTSNGIGIEDLAGLQDGAIDGFRAIGSVLNDLKQGLMITIDQGQLTPGPRQPRDNSN